MANDIKREWFETDYYAVLGVPKDAAQADVTKAYRKLARKYHPDTNPGDDAAEERFKEISGAYDVVGDEEKRASYDQARAMGPVGGGFGGSGGSSNGGFGFEGVDLGDIFGSVFGGGGQGGRTFGDQPGGRHARIKRPGRDQEARLTISFDEASGYNHFDKPERRIRQTHHQDTHPCRGRIGSTYSATRQGWTW